MQDHRLASRHPSLALLQRILPRSSAWPQDTHLLVYFSGFNQDPALGLKAPISWFTSADSTKIQRLASRHPSRGLLQRIQTRSSAWPRGKETIDLRNIVPSFNVQPETGASKASKTLHSKEGHRRVFACVDDGRLAGSGKQKAPLCVHCELV